MSLNDLELSALEKFGTEQIVESELESNKENLIQVGLSAVLEMGKIIQNSRKSKGQIIVDYKSDGTRATNIDRTAEKAGGKIITNAFPSHVLVGEEFGGNLEEEKYSWAFDPIDSTNSFLTHENTSAITLCLFKDGEVLLSFVYNPFVGEIYYAYGSDTPRLIRTYGFSKDVLGDDLPLDQIEDKEANFVNVHPTPLNDEIYSVMIKARNEGKISKVLQTGGSPAFSLASIAKGHFSFVHNWGNQPTEPWDLAAAIKIIRNLPEGRVTDGQNNDIKSIGHVGLLVASVGAQTHAKVLEIINKKDA